MKTLPTPPSMRPAWFQIGRDFSALLDTLKAQFRTRLAILQEAEITSYDTFDWRLHRAGGVLWSESLPASLTMTLRWEGPDGKTAQIVRTTPPAFASDLKDPGFDGVCSIIEPRRLIGIVSLKRSGTRLDISDSRGKTVSRVFFLCYQTERPAESRLMELDPFFLLCAVPVKGYAAAFERLRSFLSNRLGLKPTTRTPWLQGLEQIGSTPGSYTSALRVPLEPQETAGEAVRKVYEVLLAQIVLNARGTRDEFDPEFLHDFRVAVRRTRSGLSQIKGIFERGALRRFKKDFKWLGTVTGPKRDLDVHLLNLSSEAAALPDALRPGLEALRALLRARADQAQEQLVDALDSKRFRAVTQDWKQFLEDPGAAQGPKAHKAVLEVAREHIGSAYQQVLERGRSLRPSGAPEKLHALRLDCKRLRYLLEFFRSVFEEQRIGAVIGNLKNLQDRLGAINDCEVQAQTLMDMGTELYKSRSGGARAVMAVGILIDQAGNVQKRELESFGKQFKAFSGRKNRSLLEGLLAEWATEGKVC